MGRLNSYESQDRSAGIKINGSSLDLDSVVDIEGTMATANGERYINNISSYTITPAGTQKIQPFGASNKAFAKNSGLSNVGFLMKTWGKVTYIDPAGAFLYVDDGSGLSDGNTLGTDGVSATGVKVILNQTYDLSLPKVGSGSAKDSNGFCAEYMNVGDNIAVTGVVALSSDGSNTPVLVPRSSGDITYANDTYVVVHNVDDFYSTTSGGDNGGKDWTLLATSGDTDTYTFPLTGGVQCTTGSSYMRVRCHTYEGIALKNLKELKYSVYMNTMPTNAVANNTFSIQLSVDTQGVGDETCDDILIYDPYYAQGTSYTGVLGTWQVWDALKNGKWWSQNLNATNKFTHASPVSFSTYLAQYPNATLVTSSTGDDGTVYHYWQGTFSINAYPWYAPQVGFVGTLGSVTVGVNTPDTNGNDVITNTTYSFLPQVVTQ